MASLFPARVARGLEQTHVVEGVPAQGANEPFIVGDFVLCTTGESSEYERCGADPVLIAGISEVSSEAYRVIDPNGKCPVRILTGAGVVLAMSSTTTPVYATHVGNSYGITRASGGQWQLDISKTTTSSRMKVIDVNIASGIFYCVIHANLLQFADLIVATA